MTKRLMVGDVAVGGGAPVSIQSMCNTKTDDVRATVEQIHVLEAAGCEIIRIAIPDQAAAEAVDQMCIRDSGCHAAGIFLLDSQSVCQLAGALSGYCLHFQLCEYRPFRPLLGCQRPLRGSDALPLGCTKTLILSLIHIFPSTGWRRLSSGGWTRSPSASAPTSRERRTRTSARSCTRSSPTTC